MKATKLSNYEVNELLNMVSDLEHIFNMYSHVAEKTPELSKAVSIARAKLTKESNKRETHFFLSNKV